jgi:hypothetical protein
LEPPLQTCSIRDGWPEWAAVRADHNARRGFGGALVVVGRGDLLTE